jgi:ankyrin repeat protein
MFIKNRAPLNARDGLDCTPLHWAAKGGYTDIVRLLLTKGAHVNVKRNEEDGIITGQTPLHLAAEGGHTETARLLIEHGAEVNAMNSDQATPLHLAAYHDRLELANLLIKNGADVDAKGSWKITPLHRAAANIHHQVSHHVVNLLIGAGAQPDAKTKDGRTPSDISFSDGHGDLGLETSTKAWRARHSEQNRAAAGGKGRAR